MAEASDAAMAEASEGLLLRGMTLAELDEVDAIERVSFKEPWPAQTFVDELANPFARVVLALSRGRVVGFANYWLAAGECSLLAIATHPDHRGRGVGARLIAHMLEEARAAACELAVLEVRSGNLPAIALYERSGYATGYIRRGYYADGEDALVMTLPLASASL